MTRNPFAGQRTRLWLQRLESRDLLTFLTAPSFPVASSANASVIADFNGDGAGDVAVAHNQTSGKISVLIANGNNFETPVVYPATGGTRDIIAADFSGDGIIDLAAVGTTSAPNLAFFRGNGDGTFDPAQLYMASVVGSLSMVAEDFNNDGALDIATVTTAATVTIALNQGGGVFADPQQGYVANTHLTDLQAGDVNADGNADVIAVGYYCEPPPFGVCFPKNHVFFGDGNGSLTLGPTYLDFNPASVVLADFDLDQDLDFATVSSGGNVTPAVSVWLGNGDGTFALNKSYSNPTFARELTAGDIDGDGKIDLVVGNDEAKTLTVLRGIGNGQFEVDLGYALAGSASSLAAGDLNGDLDLDVVATVGSDLSVLRNRGGGALQAAAIYPLGKYPYSVANADFNGDGRVDLAVSEGNGGVDWVNVFMGRGDGTFDKSGTYAVGNSPTAIAVGDFNRDGHRDLVTADKFSNQVSVLRNKGDGTFFPASKFAAGPEPTGIVVADFTGEGFQDLVVTNSRDPGTISFLRGSGTGRFRAPVSYPAGSYPQALTFADFDGNGKNDLAVAGYDPVLESISVLILPGNGNGSFAAPIVTAVPSAWGLHSILAKDFNGDGHIDLVTAYEFPDSSMEESVFVLLGNGDSTFQPSAGYVVLNSCSSLASADFDLDGTLDLVVGIGNSLNNTLALLRGNGDGSFTQPTTFPANDYYPVGPYVQGLTTADFNSDGAPDVAAALGAYSGFPGLSIVLNSNDRSNAAEDESRPLPSADWLDGKLTDSRLLARNKRIAPQTQIQDDTGLSIGGAKMTSPSRTISALPRLRGSPADDVPIGGNLVDNT